MATPVAAPDGPTPKSNISGDHKIEAPLRKSNSLAWVGIGIGLAAVGVVLLANYATPFWTERDQTILVLLKQFLMAAYAVILILTVASGIRRRTGSKKNWLKIVASGCTAGMVLITVFISTHPRVRDEDLSKLKDENANVMDPPLTISAGNTLIAQGVELSKGDDLNRAQGALALKHYHDAILLFDKGMAPLTDKLADAHFYKGRALWLSAGDDLNKFNAAMDEVDLSLRLRPSFSPALVIQCSCLRNLVSRPHHLDEARASCENAINADSKNPAAYNAMGGVLIASKEYDAAIANFDQGIRLNATVPQLWSNRAVAIHRRAESDKHKTAEEKRAEELNALEDVNRALKLVPDFRDALLNRATIYKSLGQIGLARVTYEKLVQQDPNDAYAWNNLGDAIEAQAQVKPKRLKPTTADLNAALFAFNQALRVNSSFEDALYNKGDALTQLADFRDAIEPLEAACKIDPSDNDACAELALSYLNVGRIIDAHVVAERVLKNDPKNSMALQVRRRSRSG